MGYSLVPESRHASLPPQPGLKQRVQITWVFLGVWCIDPFTAHQGWVGFSTDHKAGGYVNTAAIKGLHSCSGAYRLDFLQNKHTSAIE